MTAEEQKAIDNLMAKKAARKAAKENPPKDVSYPPKAFEVESPMPLDSTKSRPGI